ncbi:uncharacterized protein LOC144124007 [Amblyomma americanum]
MIASPTCDSKIAFFFCPVSWRAFQMRGACPSSPANPRHWLAQVNSQFTIDRITTQAQQFHHVSASLPPEIAAEVRDLLITPPASAPFDKLAAELIKRTAASKELICSEELGDQKLTQLLRWLQQLLGDKAAIFDQAFLRDFFVQRSPSSVCLVLVNAQGLSLEKFAQPADSVIDVSYPSSIPASHPNIIS